VLGRVSRLCPWQEATRNSRSRSSEACRSSTPRLPNCRRSRLVASIHLLFVYFPRRWAASKRGGWLLRADGTSMRCWPPAADRTAGAPARRWAGCRRPVCWPHRGKRGVGSLSGGTASLTSGYAPGIGRRAAVERQRAPDAYTLLAVVHSLGGDGNSKVNLMDNGARARPRHVCHDCPGNLACVPIEAASSSLSRTSPPISAKLLR
jgi:hypothetical protein